MKESILEPLFVKPVEEDDKKEKLEKQDRGALPGEETKEQTP